MLATDIQVSVDRKGEDLVVVCVIDNCVFRVTDNSIENCLKGTLVSITESNFLPVFTKIVAPMFVSQLIMGQWEQRNENGID